MRSIKTGIIAALTFGAAMSATPAFPESATAPVNEYHARIDKAIDHWRNQRKKPEATANLVKAAEISKDLSVPTASALVALGVSRDQVARPQSPREFGLALLDGIDAKGNVQKGLALSTNPFLLTGGGNLTLSDYRNNYVNQLLARTEISVASTKAADGDSSVRFAIGLTVTPWDRGDARSRPHDPEFDPAKCIMTSLDDITKAIHEDQRGNSKNGPLIDFTLEGDLSDRKPGVGVPSQDELNKKAVETLDRILVNDVSGGDYKTVEHCHEEFRKRTWNASSWSLGVVPTWTSETGGIDDLDWSGAAYYTTFAYGFEDPLWSDLLRQNAHAILHMRYRDSDTQVAAPGDSSFVRQDTMVFGGQLRLALPDIGSRIGGADSNFLAEVSYIQHDRESGEDEEALRYSVGVEFKLTDGVYLKLQAGTEDSDDDDNDQAFTGLNISWNFHEKPTDLGRLFK